MLGGGALYLSTLLPVITGYAAKNLGSAVFVQGRDPAEADSIDLNFSFIKFNKNSVDYNDSIVTSRFLWGRSKASFRKGFGVTLLRKTDTETLENSRFSLSESAHNISDSILWPAGNLIPDTSTGINKTALSETARKLVQANGYGGNPFALVVLHKGIPVAEEYKPQFSSETKFLSWSMAKSVMNAITGIMVLEKGLDIYKPLGIEEWKNDERSKITINNLLQMTSGLEWNEDYGSRSDVNVMLFCKKDMAAYVTSKKAAYPAGEFWQYSSGSTNLLSYILRKQFNNDEEYYAFPHNRLFRRIGIQDAVFETDCSGSYIGSSYLYLTARDYARFALLYQQDGIFNGDRILPEGWVSYTRKPVEPGKGEYGSSFWLYGQGEVPSAPDDIFMCMGHDGQRIFIIPSKELIVVVLGYSPRGTLDFNALLKDILSTL